MKEYRIHPAIGIARVGNADRGAAENDGWFIGPETPGLPANYDPATGTFRPFKQDGKVKAQAARFRIWEYEERNGQLVPMREVDLDSPEIIRIEWTAELANRKAAFFKFEGQTGADGTFAKLQASALRNVTVPMAQREQLLVVAPGARTVLGRQAAVQEFRNSKTHIPVQSLGELRTDEAGRLLVLGGRGDSGFSIAISGGQEGMDDYANNDGWFDDIADGPVTARITVRQADGSERTVAAIHGAWVLVGPPDFAPPIGNTVTLYDTLWDIAVLGGLATQPGTIPLPAHHALYSEYAPGRGLPSLRAMRAGLAAYQPSFTRDIYPIFERGFQTRWVHAPLNVPSGGGSPPHSRISAQQWAVLAELPGSAPQRNAIFRRMRDPLGASPGTPRARKQMPRAWGDTYGNGASPYLSLTRTQYAMLSKWNAAQFSSDWQGEPPIPSAPDISPEGLDRAALEACVGGAFFPGIEASWLIRHPAVFVEPFRIQHGAKLSDTVIGELRVGAGFFSQQMALPWQADFADCYGYGDDAGDGVVFAWWPGQRPDEVFPEHGATVVEWARGIITQTTPGDDDTQKWHRAMVDRWHTRGFVVRHAGRYVEREGP